MGSLKMLENKVNMSRELNFSRKFVISYRWSLSPRLLSAMRGLGCCSHDCRQKSKFASAVMLMDGSRTQSAIVKEVGMDPGNLSRLVKSLGKESLIAADDKHPKLHIKLPQNFFDQKERPHE